MTRDALRSFVVDAHRNGYASSSPDAAEEADGTVIEYEDGDWRYVDRYAGSRSFLGHEIVLRDGTAVWGMHYDGRPTGEDVDHEAVYAFLRDALGEASLDHPFRGPPRYESERFTYLNDRDGDLATFRGTEAIEREGRVVYRGRYGGGVVE